MKRVSLARRPMFVLLVAVLVSGCGPQPQHFIFTGEGQEGCEFDGPTEVPAGEHVVMVTPAGQGVITVAVFEESEEGERVVRVSAQDQVDYARKTHDFEPGEYLAVCQYNEFLHSVSTFNVTP